MRSDLLHVVTAYFNPMRWESRLRLYKAFEQHMLDCGVRLTTVVCELGERPFVTGDNPNVNYVYVRAKTILWNKESLLRVGMAHLPDPDAKYICWSDADIFFRKSDWASETVHALQQYDVIQPWSDAYDLGPKDSHLAVYKSFLCQWWNGKSVVYGLESEQTNFEKTIHGILPGASHPMVPASRVVATEEQNRVGKKHHHHHHHHHHPPTPPTPPVPPPYYGFVPDAQVKKMPWWTRDGGLHEYPHTGYAWAATRKVIDGIGGLFDLAAMGAGDYHMALALVGHAARSMPGTVHPAYRKHMMEWEARAMEHVNFNMGYLQGTVEHTFHGAKGNRRYVDRWQIILEHDFDPDVDILRNAHGVFELRCTKPKLRHDLAVYFAQRSEDDSCIL